MTNHFHPRILLLKETERDLSDIGTSIADGFTQLGCQVTVASRFTPQQWTTKIADFDIICTYGPHEHIDGFTGMLEIAKSLTNCLPNRRPFFVWWLCENFLDLRIPLWLISFLTATRWQADRLLEPAIFSNLKIKKYLSIGHRARILAEARYFQAQGLLDLLLVTFHPRVEFLHRLGIQSSCLPLGYHPNYGTDLGIERDIEVLFLGRPNKKRRGQLLSKVQADLQKRDIKLTIYDGSEGYLWGKERTHYLNRVKILLNLLQSPVDVTGHRFLLGMANKALIISEPLLDPSPYESNKHFISVSSDQMVDKVIYYLTHETERQQIVDTAYQFVTMTWTMANHCRQVIHQFAENRSLNPFNRI